MSQGISANGMILQPSEYNESYFEGGHRAGYTRYDKRDENWLEYANKLKILYT